MPPQGLPRASPSASAALAAAPRRLADVRRALLAHYRRHRRDLPWRAGALARDAYAIWVCEIMAQQTQIDRVARYFTAWMARFPTVAALAAAPLDDVLAAWAGLGYYARARALHRAANLVVSEHAGVMPRDLDALRRLPGIGRYTAGAIASIAHGQRAAAVDGNVMRVLARVFAISDDLARPAGQARIWSLAETLVPARSPGDFNQALFDLGATVCTPRAPTCTSCPLEKLCLANQHGAQAELPRIVRTTKVKAVAQDSLRIAAHGDADALLLCRRAPRGLYGGLWEMPARELLAAFLPDLEVDDSRVLAAHTHKLSHRTISHRVFAAAPRARLGAAQLTRLAALLKDAGEAYDDVRFFTAAERHDLGVSSATRSLLAALRPENPCSRIRAPARSSKKASARSSPG